MAGTISTLGVGSGLDLQGILDKLRAADQGPIDKKKTAITAANEQISEFTTVNNKLLSLKSAALDLSLSGTFIGRKVTSSDEKVATATVGDGAAVGSLAIVVTNLAAKNSWLATTGMAKTSDSMTAIDQEVSLQVGSDITNKMTITVKANTTLSELVEQINSANDNPGLTASIIDDGSDATSPYKLALTSNNSGENYRITGTGLAMAETAGDLNAKFSVNGIPYQRQSNVIDDLLSGVTLTLKSASTATLAVAADDSGLQEKIVNLVKLYNEVTQEVKGKSSYDSTTKTYGVLSSTVVRELPFELQDLMSTANSADSTGTIKSLFDLGLEVGRDGTIAVNATTLAAALAASPEGVKSFFLGDSEQEIEGFADTVNNRLRTLTSGTGLMSAEKKAAQARIEAINLQIERETAKLNKKYDGLAKQFSALDTFMSKMNSVGNYLTSQFDAYTGTTNKSK